MRLFRTSKGSKHLRGTNHFCLFFYISSGNPMSPSLNNPSSSESSLLSCSSCSCNVSSWNFEPQFKQIHRLVPISLIFVEPHLGQFIMASVLLVLLFTFGTRKHKRDQLERSTTLRRNNPEYISPSCMSAPSSLLRSIRAKRACTLF